MNDYEYRFNDESKERRFNAFLTRVFMWMFSGVTLSFATAYVTANNEAVLEFIDSLPFTFIFLLILELFLTSYLEANLTRISENTASGLFMFFSFLNGLTLSFIFVVFDLGSISTALFVSSVLFGVMALYGRLTSKDLTPKKSLIMMGLFGILIAFPINFLIQSPAVDYLISATLIILFSGLTAWHIQDIMYEYYRYDDEVLARNFAIVGALDLYIDFVQIFIAFIRLADFSKRD
ncbi:MAG: Bax inhibitor-1/YccA family protein [Bacillota bacterium]|nr:Bax inhibitor-1/YccA family protein [Bacillota bacterium]